MARTGDTGNQSGGDPAGGAPTRARSRAIAAAGLAALTGAALLVRVWGIGFPPYHGDEGWNYVIPAVNYFSGDFNPHHFHNPTLTSYLMYGLYYLWYLAGSAAGSFHAPIDMLAQYQYTPLPFYVLGRLVSVTLGALTVPVVFAVARRVYGRRAAWLAALFMAFAFLHVRDSHFAVSDVPLTFWVMLCVLFALRWQQGAGDRAWLNSIWAGLCLGLAMATKYTAVSLCLTIACAGLVNGSPVFGRHPLRAVVGESPGRRSLLVLGGMGCAVLGAFLACPYCFLDLDSVRASFRAISENAQAGFLGERLSELTGFPYYLATLGWGLGWPLLALGLGGAVMAAWRNRREDWLLLTFPVVLYVLQATQVMVYARFIIPAIPFLAVFAGSAADRLVNALAVPVGDLPRTAGGGAHRAAPALAAVLVVALAWPVTSAARADYLFTQPDTRDLALDWLQGHVDAEASIAREWQTPCLSSPGEPCPGGGGYVFNAELIPRIGLGTYPLSYYRERHVDYLVASSYVWPVPAYDIDRERVRAQLYRDLEAQAELAAAFRPYAGDTDAGEPPFVNDMIYGPATSLFDLERLGPTIKIYRLRDTGAVMRPDLPRPR